MHITDSLSIFSLCTVAVIIGTANSAQGSARQTIVPRIVDKPTIANAVAFNAMNFQIRKNYWTERWRYPHWFNWNEIYHLVFFIIFPASIDNPTNDCVLTPKQKVKV